MKTFTVCIVAILALALRIDAAPSSEIPETPELSAPALAALHLEAASSAEIPEIPEVPAPALVALHLEAAPYAEIPETLEVLAPLPVATVEEEQVPVSNDAPTAEIEVPIQEAIQLTETESVKSEIGAQSVPVNDDVRQGRYKGGPLLNGFVLPPRPLFGR